MKTAKQLQGYIILTILMVLIIVLLDLSLKGIDFISNLF